MQQSHSLLRTADLRALQVIRSYIAHRSRTPTVRELASELGFSSPRTGMLIIHRLEEAGALSRKEDGTLKLVRSVDQDGIQTVSVPVVGSAPCGTPVFAEENIETYVSIATTLARPPHHYFVVRANGDSMNRAGIDNGDLVLVRSTAHADDGDRVVALVDGEVTVKILQRNAEAVALEPRSTDARHHTVFASTDLIIQGVVVACLPHNGK